MILGKLHGAQNLFILSVANFMPIVIRVSSILLFLFSLLQQSLAFFISDFTLTKSYRVVLQFLRIKTVITTIYTHTAFFYFLRITVDENHMITGVQQSDWHRRNYNFCETTLIYIHVRYAQRKFVQDCTGRTYIIKTDPFLLSLSLQITLLLESIGLTGDVIYTDFKGVEQPHKPSLLNFTKAVCHLHLKYYTPGRENQFGAFKHILFLQHHLAPLMSLLINRPQIIVLDAVCGPYAVLSLFRYMLHEMCTKINFAVRTASYQPSTYSQRSLIKFLEDGENISFAVRVLYFILSTLSGFLHNPGIC